MRQGVNRGNSTVKTKSLVWDIKVGVYSSDLIMQHRENSEPKLWKVKIILN